MTVDPGTWNISILSTTAWQRSFELGVQKCSFNITLCRQLYKNGTMVMRDEHKKPKLHWHGRLEHEKTDEENENRIVVDRTSMRRTVSTSSRGLRIRQRQRQKERT